MRISRGYFAVVMASVFALTAVCAFSLFGYFKAVERSGGGQGSERRIVDTLKLMHSNLSLVQPTTDSAVEARAMFRTLSQHHIMTYSYAIEPRMIVEGVSCMRSINALPLSPA